MIKVLILHTIVEREFVKLMDNLGIIAERFQGKIGLNNEDLRWDIVYYELTQENFNLLSIGIPEDSHWIVKRTDGHYEFLGNLPTYFNSNPQEPMDLPCDYDDII